MMKYFVLRNCSSIEMLKGCMLRVRLESSGVTEPFIDLPAIGIYSISKILYSEDCILDFYRLSCGLSAFSVS